jgi:hypothetical protein
MSRFYKTLNEYQEDNEGQASRVKSINAKEAYSLAETKASKAVEEYKRGTLIRRITRTAQSITFGFLDARKLPLRMSRNTLNYYTHIMNNDPIWSKFPKRQIIASGDFTSGYTQKDEFIIFPFNGVKIGVCPVYDLWDSFHRFKKFPGVIMASNFNRWINDLLRWGNGKGDNDKSYSVFKKACKDFDNKIKTMENEDSDFNLTEFSELMADSDMNIGASGDFFANFYNGNLYESILYFFNPEGFKLIKAGDKMPNRDVEVWLDGPALYVNGSIVDDFINGNFTYSGMLKKKKKEDIIYRR